MYYIHLNNSLDGKEHVFNILSACGHNMFEKNGLEHWLPDYPLESIEKDCKDKFVVLVYDEIECKFISTFQMYIENEGELYIRKVATLPEFQGKGIGRKNLEYIYEFAHKLNIKKVCLDVYDKSEAAINFYLHNGFRITGKRKTRRFEVILMERIIS